MFMEAIGSALLNNVFADNRQDDQQAFNAQQYATRYQTTVKDLSAAGLNPMMAYNGIGGSFPTSGIAQPSGGGVDFVGAQLAQANIDNVRAQARLTNAEAALKETYGGPRSQADLDLAISQSGLNNQTVAKLQTEMDNNVQILKNLGVENYRLQKAADMIIEQSNLYFQQSLSENARYDLMRAQAREMVSKAGLNENDLKAAEKYGNLGAETKQVRAVLDFLRMFITRH